MVYTGTLLRNMNENEYDQGESVIDSQVNASGVRTKRGTKGNRREQQRRYRIKNRVKYREYMRKYMANRVKKDGLDIEAPF